MASASCGYCGHAKSAHSITVSGNRIGAKCKTCGKQCVANSHTDVMDVMSSLNKPRAPRRTNTSRKR